MAITTKQDLASRLQADEMANALLTVQCIQDNTSDKNKSALIAVDNAYTDLDITEVDGVNIGEESVFEHTKGMLIQAVKSSL